MDSYNIPQCTEEKQSNEPINEKKKNKAILWLLWWMLDKDVLDKQVEGYNNLSVGRASRKVAALLLIFSSIVTTVFVMFSVFSMYALIDVVLMLAIAFFVYRGHRWAMMLAMLYWTCAKLSMICTNFSVVTLLSSIVFWTIYMHVFYESFKVEQLRREKSNSC
jgi:lysylphosphatidylglycerol synthetase-like protein (DUF2156 family)